MEEIVRERTCINCSRPLPAKAPYLRYCDRCMPAPRRERTREQNRRASERYKAKRLAALALVDRMRCRHCDLLAKPAPYPLEFPKPAERVKWFCDGHCQRAYR
jgi:hypothetical protein